VLSITRNPDNPANKHIGDISEYAKDYKVDLSLLIKVLKVTFPPWNTKFDINLELTKFKKKITPPIIYKNHLNEVLQRHKNDNLFYTDASKSEEGVGIAIIGENLTSIFRLLVESTYKTPRNQKPWPNPNLNRREKIVINRLRIGHSRFNPHPQVPYESST